VLIFQQSKTDGASTITTGPRHPMTISMNWSSTDYMRFIFRPTEGF
jgi:hypothetical protein